MNSGFAGPERRAVHEAIRRRLDLELVHGSTTRRALDDRYDLALRYRELMGQVLGGASPDEIAITGNTSEGINIVVNGLDVDVGRLPRHNRRRARIGHRARLLPARSAAAASW